MRYSIGFTKIVHGCMIIEAKDKTEARKKFLEGDIDEEFDNKIKSFLIKNYETTGNGNFNLYFAFFEMGLHLLNEKGMLGYITPNNYFTSLAGKDLRKFLQDRKVINRIIDFNHLKIFEDEQLDTLRNLDIDLSRFQNKYLNPMKDTR